MNIKFITVLVFLALLVSCAPDGSAMLGYKVTIDDGDPLTPVRAFSTSRYYWSDSGALCYQVDGDSLGPYYCYMKAINESITVEPIKEEK